MSESNQEYIEISGARENNLKNVSLRIPKRKITIFTGVSGSGKSSIVFDTIAAESQRLLNENFSMFVRNFLPRYSATGCRRDREPEHGGHRRPEAAWAAVPIPRWARLPISHPFCVFCSPEWVSRMSDKRNMFSFNDPQGMCPECNGMGRSMGVDLSKALDRQSRSMKAQSSARTMR